MERSRSVVERVKRNDLAHIIRAAARVAEDEQVLIVGSQAILASFDEHELPPEATASVEADVTFIDGDEEKADRVEGAIGEASQFHQSFGYYGKGVGLSTAVLPSGWEDRLVPFGWGIPGQPKPCALTRTIWYSPSWWQAARRIGILRLR